jgi:hypothetical protein
LASSSGVESLAWEKECDQRVWQHKIISTGDTIHTDIEQEKQQPYLDLVNTPWEDNRLGLVGLQPLDISLQTLK